MLNQSSKQMADNSLVISIPVGKLERQIRRRISFFIAGLVFSGVTAFPIESELSLAHRWISVWNAENEFSQWIENVYGGVVDTNGAYPFISYGSDWLGFAHLVIAIAFVGPLKDPVRNRWVIEFGLMACVAIFPFAFIAGYIRQIPVFWRLIDCTFGLAGGWILWNCYLKIKILENIKPYEQYTKNSRRRQHL